MIRFAISALFVLLLSACGGDGAKKAEGAGTAQGEILPGSVSDAMIPLDQVKSQAPLAPKTEGGDTKDANAGEDPNSATTGKPADEPAPAEAEPAAEE